MSNDGGPRPEGGGGPRATASHLTRILIQPPSQERSVSGNAIQQRIFITPSAHGRPAPKVLVPAKIAGQIRFPSAFPVPLILAAGAPTQMPAAIVIPISSLPSTSSSAPPALSPLYSTPKCATPTGVPEVSSTSSPLSHPRPCSVAAVTSSTPDGPLSLPSSHHEDEHYEDMPQLVPVDQDNAASSSRGQVSSTVDGEGASSFSISPHMDLNEIAAQLSSTLDERKMKALLQMFQANNKTKKEKADGKETKGPRMKRKEPPKDSSRPSSAASRKARRESTTTPIPKEEIKTEKVEAERTAKGNNPPPQPPIKAEVVEEVKKEEEEEKKTNSKVAQAARKRKIPTPVDEKPRPPSTLPVKRHNTRGVDTDDAADEYTVLKRCVLSPSCRPLPVLPSPLVCGCTRGACNAAHDCISRATRTFCLPSTCPLPACSNRHSMDHSLYVKGRSLRTSVPWKAHQFLCEYTGELVSPDELHSRLSSLPSTSDGPPSIRALALSPDHFIDATHQGSMARFLKHSCQPNCVLQVWNDNGSPRLCLLSRFPLGTDTELNADLSSFTPVPIQCNCHAKRCKKVVPASAAMARFGADFLASSPLFLMRNLRKKKVSLLPSRPRNSTIKKYEGAMQLWQLARSVDGRFRRADGRVRPEMGALLANLRLAARRGNKLFFCQVLVAMEERTEESVDTNALICIRNHVVRDKVGREDGDEAPKRKGDRRLPRQYTTTYLDTHPPVLSYNPEDWPSSRFSTDAIRCTCGSLVEEGSMVQCDECKYWLHIDCLAKTPAGGRAKYSCPFCRTSRSVPWGDILLKDLPEITLHGCTYYKSLCNSIGLQIRENECVYVRATTSEKPKAILRALEKKKSLDDVVFSETFTEDGDVLCGPLPRSSLRVFRVERLFEAPGGQRFLFGFHYARPHETFAEINRGFHPNEVFKSPLYDTLPLDAVHGKCLVLDPTIYSLGRPIFPIYKDEDIFFCEFQVDRQQKMFEKIKKDKRVKKKNEDEDEEDSTYPINLKPYAFTKFKSARTIHRNFTPFIENSSPRLDALTSQEELEANLKKYSTQRVNRIVNRFTCTDV